MVDLKDYVNELQKKADDKSKIKKGKQKKGGLSFGNQSSAGEDVLDNELK